jgi:hypothetical protein
MNYTNNFSVARNNYNGPLATSDFINNPNNNLFVSGNKMRNYAQYADYQLFYCCNDFNVNAPNTDLGSAVRLGTRNAFPLISTTLAADLQQYVIKNVGAFPRDPMDRRLINPISQNVIASQIIDGVDYFNDAFQLDFITAPTAPIDSDNDGMPNEWETANGLNPNLEDHNGTQLSKKFTGVNGYTNLECYLNELSDKKIGNTSIIINPPSTTITSLELNTTERVSATISPNPSEVGILIKVNGQAGSAWRFEMIDTLGRILTEESNIVTAEKTFLLPRLIQNGTYFIKIYLDGSTIEQRIVVLK